MDELAQWTIVAGNWHVPMVMVSGDEAACVEARNFFKSGDASGALFEGP